MTLGKSTIPPDWDTNPKSVICFDPENNVFAVTNSLLVILVLILSDADVPSNTFVNPEPFPIKLDAEIYPLELILFCAIIFPINVCVSVGSSPNIFDPEVSIVDAVINEAVKWVTFSLNTSIEEADILDSREEGNFSDRLVDRGFGLQPDNQFNILPDVDGKVFFLRQANNFVSLKLKKGSTVQINVTDKDLGSTIMCLNSCEGSVITIIQEWWIYLKKV